MLYSVLLKGLFLKDRALFNLGHNATLDGKLVCFEKKDTVDLFRDYNGLHNEKTQFHNKSK